jgi:hypothetical protein
MQAAEWRDAVGVNRSKVVAHALGCTALQPECTRLPPPETLQTNDGIVDHILTPGSVQVIAVMWLTTHRCRSLQAKYTPLPPPENLQHAGSGVDESKRCRPQWCGGCRNRTQGPAGSMLLVYAIVTARKPEIH